ncbi:hypothetical protein RGQ29_024497, partial [Quercus rubra]
METDSSSFPSSSSSATARWKYDVFLSFRGEDTRHNFVGHLYEALIQKGIHTFKDDKNLDRGKPISPELLKAIEESRFAIIIISKDYASSAWCLDELAHIIHCKKEMGMTILPVFHYVDPSNIRNQMGTFEQAFIKHEEKENKERVEKWRDALRQVGNLAGCHLKNTRCETEDIKDILGWISLHLKYDAFPYISRDLVGIYSRMVELESLLAIGSNDVRFIGVWGMGGMGKTTLARVVYHTVSKEFEAYGFIEDVRENSEKHGLVGLQQKLISNILEETDLKIRDKDDGVLKIRNRLCHKRILLVLDDVNKLNQLKMLAGEYDWFGPGSRIIITTRDEHVLKAHKVNEIYEVEGLNHEHALQLFSSKAFKDKHVLDGYLQLSEHFLNYASGLPLALEVLGSFLIGKNIVEWRSALKRLKEYPDDTVLRVLKISYDELHVTAKEIFLHIACFFNHEKKDIVVEVLDGLDLYPDIGLKELIDKSLLKIMYTGRVWMHDLLENMGKNIVHLECPNDPGKRSRLWHYEDIDKVLRENKGIKEVQAMRIYRNLYKEKKACWNPKALVNMYSLKFLKIESDFYARQHLPYFQRFPNSLRIIDWKCYPSKSFTSTSQLDELVQLYLQGSSIEQLCIGRKNFDKLKIIDLSYSSLIISPDFTGVPNLEKLTLSNCSNLCELHPTICSLKFLKNLDISGCSKIDNLPEILGNVKALLELNLSGTAIKVLPSSFGGLIGLTSLILTDCKNLVCLPSSICSLKCLDGLDLSGCSNFDKLPKNLGYVKSLMKLNLSGTAIKVLPSSIGGLIGLTSLILTDCKNLVCLPSSICSLKCLDGLDLVLLAYLSCLDCLRSLELSDCNIWAIPDDIGSLSSLEELNLSGNNFVSLPDSISQLCKLEFLYLEGCKRLHSLAVFPPTTKFVTANYCTSLERLPALQNDTFISSLTSYRFEYLNCFNLVDNIQSGINMLQVSLSQHSGKHLRGRLDIVIPGSEVPTWFTQESMGHKVKIQIPSDEWDERMGIALCVVFVPNEHHQYPRDCKLSCSFEVNGCQMKNPVVFEFTEDYGKLESHHLWLLYLS